MRLCFPARRTRSSPGPRPRIATAEAVASYQISHQGWLRTTRRVAPDVVRNLGSLLLRDHRLDLGGGRTDLAANVAVPGVQIATQKVGTGVRRQRYERTEQRVLDQVLTLIV